MALRAGSLKHLLQWLIAGSRGGVNRALIIIALRDEPRNANQLSGILNVDYRTVRHHIDLLEKNRLIMSIGDRYGKMYFLAPELEENFTEFERIWNQIGKKLNRKNKE